ncbi:hypothetical protein BP00DRAFT_428909 [Aspergillus indologenus CBS 114.80]|uniref:Uncharacterized protein n=1 Tax=Aspergillus indologenus CBS 114.80 TaxID=1450541 RepID=A0A2V5J2X8_9EURO|nr:hypothetical protein BP00DRAFT_428909 [Aspergillus indologenus CBS 114.80]
MTLDKSVGLDPPLLCGGEDKPGRDRRLGGQGTGRNGRGKGKGGLTPAAAEEGRCSILVETWRQERDLENQEMRSNDGQRRESLEEGKKNGEIGKTVKSEWKPAGSERGEGLETGGKRELEEGKEEPSG